MTSIESRQTLMTMIIRVVGMLFGAVATALIARLLQPEKFGEYSFVLAVASILSMPLVLGLRQTLVREIAYARALSEGERIDLIWGWALRRAVCACGLVALAWSLWIFWGVSDPDRRWHLALGVGVFLLLPAPKLLGGVLHGMGRTVQSQFPEFVLRPILTIALLISVLIFAGPTFVTVANALIIFAVALLADTVLTIAMLRRGAGFRFLPPKPTDLFVTKGRLLTASSLSFGAIASVQLINNKLDIVMLGVLGTDAQVGVYKAATVLSALAVFGLGAINTVIMPKIAKMHAQGNRAQLQTMITKSVRIITIFAIGGALISCIFGTFLLTFIFNENYGGGYWVLVILTFGQFANACFGPVALILNMTGNQKLTLIGVSAAVLLNAGLNLMLVPRYGMEGAAMATTASLVLWNAVLALALKARTGYSSSIF